MEFLVAEKFCYTVNYRTTEVLDCKIRLCKQQKEPSYIVILFMKMDNYKRRLLPRKYLEMQYYSQSIMFNFYEHIQKCDSTLYKMLPTESIFKVQSQMSTH